MGLGLVVRLRAGAADLPAAEPSLAGAPKVFPGMEAFLTVLSSEIAGAKAAKPRSDALARRLCVSW